MARSAAEPARTVATIVAELGCVSRPGAMVAVDIRVVGLTGHGRISP